MRRRAQAVAVLLSLATGWAHAQTIIEQAVAARNRGAVFTSLEILRQAGPAPSAAVRIEQAAGAFILGRYSQARAILAGVLADPDVDQADRNRAVALVLRINRRQLRRMARGPFSATLALGIGADSNANNVLDSSVPDDFDAVPGRAAREPLDDFYRFYRAAAEHALQPSEAANLGGHPFVYRWTNSVAHYGRRFRDVDAWNAQYVQLTSGLRFEKRRVWTGSIRASALDYRLGEDRLAYFGSAEASYKRLLQPVNVGVQAAFQRLDYRQAAWTGLTGKRLRVQLFVEGALAERHSFRAGLEPQRFRGDEESRSHSGFRAHLQHAWRRPAWRLYTRVIYEKNRYRMLGPGAAPRRRFDRVRFLINFEKPLTERLRLYLGGQYTGSDSSQAGELDKKQLELSLRYRF